MLKLIICVISGTLLAAVMLQLRQQRLELAYETTELHDQIRGQQARLWNQQLLIASCTVPNAISQTVDVQGLKLVPESDPLNLVASRLEAEPHQRRHGQRGH